MIVLLCWRCKHPGTTPWQGQGIAIQMKITFLTVRTSQTWAKERAQAKEQPKEKANDMPKEEAK